MKENQITSQENLTKAKKLLDGLLSPLNKEDKNNILRLLLEITDEDFP